MSDATPPAGAGGASEGEVSIFEVVGGLPWFTALVERFYEGVATDPVLRPMYPEEDLGPAEDRLRLFLIQYWGGPGTYSQQRGHPRLRMRHAPFRVDPTARDAWLRPSPRPTARGGMSRSTTCPAAGSGPSASARPRARCSAGATARMVCATATPRRACVGS